MLQNLAKKRVGTRVPPLPLAPRNANLWEETENLTFFFFSENSNHKCRITPKEKICDIQRKLEEAHLYMALTLSHLKLKTFILLKQLMKMSFVVKETVHYFFNGDSLTCLQGWSHYSQQHTTHYWRHMKTCYSFFRLNTLWGGRGGWKSMRAHSGGGIATTTADALTTKPSLHLTWIIRRPLIGESIGEEGISISITWKIKHTRQFILLYRIYLGSEIVSCLKYDMNNRQRMTPLPHSVPPLSSITQNVISKRKKKKRKVALNLGT